jgi:hypothetical protein
MGLSMPPTDFIFTENADVDVAQLNDLYRLIGWDRRERRTNAEPFRC